MMLSIIIPVYNEEGTISTLLEHLSGSRNAEIIVVDGSSPDRTWKIVQEYGVKGIRTIKNRAWQLNEGARIAEGEALVFLHADCLPEKGSLEKIRDCLRKGFVGGCLSQRIDSSRSIYRFIEESGNVRARLLGVFYGDQAIFVRRDVFFALGGFDRVELFDDVMFSRKLKRAGRTCVLKEKVHVAARRWEKQGIIKTVLINWLLTATFWLGISPRRLKSIYQDIR